MTEDEKIHDIAVAMIRRKSISPEEWQFTCIGGLHRFFAAEISVLPGELVVASAIVSPDNWYVFTTRRLVSCFQGQRSEAKLSNLQTFEYGNFKGYGAKPTEVATAKFFDGSEVQIKYETGKASMAPIYAARYWQQKNPSLEKLKA